MSKSSALYVARCKKAWDGDSFGNEWTCGAAVYKDQEGGFRVFEDDGHGNGSGLGSFASLFDAKRFADLHCKFLDDGGCAGSDAHLDMCRLAEAGGS